MKKISSLILISFILFINIFIPISVFAETAYQYKIYPLGTTQNNFKTLSDCTADQNAYKLTSIGIASTLGPCEPYQLTTSSNDPILINNKTTQDESVGINAKIDVAKNDSVYTMLAPIGGLKTMNSTGCAEGDNSCISNNIGKYLNLIFKIGIGICAALAVIMLIISGVTYMGDESIFGKTEAKHKMYSAVFGLLIALGAWALLNTINPALTGLGGVNIDSANISLERTSGGGYFGVTIGTPGSPNANTNITTYDSYLKSASQKYGLNCTLLKAFMYAESGGVNGLTSPAGAQGLIQLMPATFKEQNVGSNPMDAQTNIMAGASYLSNLQKTGCNGTPQSSVCTISNVQYLAASYNGGPGANKPSAKCTSMTVWQCPQTVCNNGTDCFKETRTYAPRVEANFNKLKENNWGC